MISSQLSNLKLNNPFKALNWQLANTMYGPLVSVIKAGIIYNFITINSFKVITLKC